MGWIIDNYSILYPGVLAAIYLRPEYAFANSRVVTILISFAIITGIRVFYQLVLYPDYFSEIKHIQTPSVSPCLVVVCPTMKLIQVRVDHG